MNREVVKIILSVFVAMAIITAAWMLKGTAYENAWLYITCIWIVLLPLMDLYSRKKNDKNQ